MKKIYFFIILSILSAFYINANNVNINSNINEQFSNIKYLSSHFEEYIGDSISDRTRYRNNPAYVGDVNAEAQRICFEKNNSIITYPLNPDNGYDPVADKYNNVADILDPNINFSHDPYTDNLMAPSWFYIEPTTAEEFTIKITKVKSSGDGNNIDYICFKVPKAEDPTALTGALTGSSNIIYKNLDVEYPNDDPSIRLC